MTPREALDMLGEFADGYGAEADAACEVVRDAVERGESLARQLAPEAPPRSPRRAGV